MDFAGMFDLPVSAITRESFFNIGGPHGFWRWGIYIFMILAGAYLIYSLINRVLVWSNGKKELRFDFPEKRIWTLIKYVILQAKVLRESYAGIMHASLFFGVVGLFIVTMFIMIQDDFTELFFHYRFLEGNFYLLWSLMGDLCGLVVLAGLGMAIYRRYIAKPNRLDTKPTDNFALILLTVIIVTGFLCESMRIAITGMPSFEVFSPVGYAIAFPLSIFGTGALEGMHYISWWVHVLCSFTAIALLASDKIGHILISALNVYFSNLENEDPKTKYAMNIIPPEEFETAETFGASKIEDFTWKQLMDSDACVRCGRCQDNCPAYLTEKPLSPKKIINDIKDNMDERVQKLRDARAALEDPTTLDKSTVESKALIGESVEAEDIWSCTNCSACLEACPIQIEHTNKINDMRRYLVLMEGNMSSELQTTFTNMENNSNPYGFAFAARGDWVPEDITLKTLSEDQNVDFLYFVGCAASYDDRNKKVAAALVKILQKAGYKVGILGAEEACCGDSAMRAGNEYLFHALAAQNLETFKTYGVKKIITSCPHGYNVLKKEYPKFAKVGVDSNGDPLEINYEIYHHTEIIKDIIAKGQIKLKDSLNAKITYHDSCFLGRYNEIYSEPRDIIKAIPGTDFVEMSRNHRTSFCCGAGGGRMWIEEDLGTRINQFRTKDAQGTGASQVGTACPFCLTMISDGVTELDIQNIETSDLAELVYNAMEK